MPEDYPVIHLDTDPWELAKNYPEQVSILGEPKVTLPELTTAVLQRSVCRRGRTARREAAGRMSGRRALPAWQNCMPWPMRWPNGTRSTRWR